MKNNYIKVNKDIDLLKNEIKKLNLLSEQDLASFTLSLKGLFEDAIDKSIDKSEFEKKAKIKFDSLLYLIKPAKELLKKNDFDSFGQAIAYMKVKLIDIADNAKLGINIIKKIQVKLEKYR